MTQGEGEGVERARSATEAFVYRRLETLAGTQGRFRLNAGLPIPFDESSTMEVDLLCDDARIAVELDGAQHWSGSASRSPNGVAPMFRWFDGPGASPFRCIETSLSGRSRAFSAKRALSWRTSSKHFSAQVPAQSVAAASALVQMGLLTISQRACRWLNS
jgi:hypothetical protein